METIILILGILFSTISIMVFFFKNKLTILSCFLVTNLIMLTQYILQGYILECLIVVVSIVKSIVFLIFAQKKLKPNYVVIIIFEIAMLICGIVTWSNWFSILFLIASMLNTYASWQDNVFLMRILYIVSALFMITNYVCTGLYVNIIAKSGTIISALCGIIIHDIIGKIKQKRKVEKQFQEIV